MCYTRIASVSFANVSSNMPRGFYQIASDPESEGTIIAREANDDQDRPGLGRV